MRLPVRLSRRGDGVRRVAAITAWSVWILGNLLLLTLTLIWAFGL